ncbi:MAG: nucleoside-diphosphate sugar epimerase/dehydratase [Anaerolineales bacterium]|nr:nucleoside-diphosphate sugar epimerase/dehydratase [Anaerolineales bacterium]
MEEYLSTQDDASQQGTNPSEGLWLRRSILSLRNWHFLILDVIFLSLTPLMALTLRLTPPWPSDYYFNLALYTVLAVLIKLAVFRLFKLYSRYWRYASIDELITITFSTFTATVMVAGLYWSLQALGWTGRIGLPRSLPFIDGLLTLFVVGGTRFSLRAVEYWQSRNTRLGRGKKVLVVGAGDAGEIVVREMLSSRFLSLDPVGFVDDDPHKVGTAIHGVRVLGTIEQIPKIAADYQAEEIVIAIPSAPGSLVRRVVRLAQEANVPSRTVPGIYEILNDRIRIDRLRKVKIEDLLRREPVQLDTDNVSRMLTGKRVLVTGAGGSIGSELCRQIIRFNPAQLVLLGHGENSLYQLEWQLARILKQSTAEEIPEVKCVIADVRDLPRLQSVASRLAPQIVFHAAAHKHVLLMEENPEEAVTNNVLGTRNVLQVAQRAQVERFVFISTDKAVNPVNMMGMSKRLAELLVQRAAESTDKPFVSVRFGNVLGSRGSVVPMFQQQIAEGGPVTITHPETTRFFMTIQEAVQLVLQAAAMGRGGEVFVLDMGEPVRIVDLVRDMIELSGYQPDVDIPIVFTGMRPGEKMREELFMQDEKPEMTAHEKISFARSQAVYDFADFEDEVDDLLKLARSGDSAATRKKLHQLTSAPAFVATGSK